MSRGYKGTRAEREAAMGIDWMTKNELNEAIPPAYTQFIGEQLMGYMLSLKHAQAQLRRDA